MKQLVIHSILVLFVFIHSLSGLAEVPFVIPDPDDDQGDLTKPVQVYILAGQSNMVGMGNLDGARNFYTGIYLSSDPKVQMGEFDIYQVGKFKIDRITTTLTNGNLVDKPLDSGLLSVPLHGEFLFQCGFQESSNCSLIINGKVVYKKNEDEDAEKSSIQLEPGMTYSFSIQDYHGEIPRFWAEKKDLLGNGDLNAVAKREKKFPWLVDDEGNWSERKDVYFQEARLNKDGKGSLLSATSNGRSIGPELGFGHVLGTYHDEQVLLIKTAQGNRSLGFDFRPPSSGRTDPDNKFESIEYQLMIEGVSKTLENIGTIVPGYEGQGYEIAGFAWFQGHKDSFSEQNILDYEKNLTHLINDIRRDLGVPKLPVVVATVGFGGFRMQEKFLRILQAQIAVGDKLRHPEFQGNVGVVDTRGFWREVGQSPKSEDYHYNRNAETYMLIGDALGRAMVRLRGGKAEPIPNSFYAKPSLRDQKNESYAETKNNDAIRPIVLDGILKNYMTNSGKSKALIDETLSVRPSRPNQFLRGASFGIENIFQFLEDDEYSWKPFGPNLDNGKWDYFSFDPSEKLAIDKGNRFRKVSYPAGMNSWMSPDFDPQSAGWNNGFQPFGQLDGKLEPLVKTCTAYFCGCSIKPKTLWEKEVLLMRRTVSLPPTKPGHRYRIIVGGAAHVNSGEGYALYINGKLLFETNRGVAVRQGGQPRGSHIYSDFLDDINSREVTIAATSFLRYNHPRQGVQPPRGHFWLRIEEQKLPSQLLQLAAESK